MRPRSVAFSRTMLQTSKNHRPLCHPIALDNLQGSRKWVRRSIINATGHCPLSDSWQRALVLLACLLHSHRCSQQQRQALQPQCQQALPVTLIPNPCCVTLTLIALKVKAPPALAPRNPQMPCQSQPPLRNPSLLPSCFWTCFQASMSHEGYARVASRLLSAFRPECRQRMRHLE